MRGTSLNTTESAEFAVNIFKPFNFSTRSEIIVMHILNDFKSNFMRQRTTGYTYKRT